MSSEPAPPRVRPATAEDAAACAAVYAPYVTGSVITFEAVPPTVEQMAARIEAANAMHAWLVAEDDHDHVVGYAYAGPFAPRPAYRWSCEVSVYLEPALRRAGAGRALYGALLPRLSARGYRTALAGMTTPNEASERFHRAMGFRPAGLYKAVGWKLGAWRDVAWMQRPLGAGQDPPAEPV